MSLAERCGRTTVILGEAHLRRVLRVYAGYYNEIRTHRTLQKDTPIHREIPEQPIHRPEAR